MLICCPWFGGQVGATDDARAGGTGHGIIIDILDGTASRIGWICDFCFPADAAAASTVAAVMTLAATAAAGNPRLIAQFLNNLLRDSFIAGIATGHNERRLQHAGFGSQAARLASTHG